MLDRVAQRRSCSSKEFQARSPLVPDIVWMTREATPAELNETPRSSGSQRAQRKSLEAETHFIRGRRRRQRRRRRCNKRMSQWRSTGRNWRKP